MGMFVLASPAGASAPAAVTAPITLNYTATFQVTPDDPSPCEGVPITDTATGTGSHLGRFTATYPHCGLVRALHARSHRVTSSRATLAG